VIVDRLEDGTITTRLFQDEQGSAPMLNILGYSNSSNTKTPEEIVNEEIKVQPTKLASV
jgi:arginine decarboxylase